MYVINYIVMLICCISFSQHETLINVKSYIGIHDVDLKLT